MKRTIGYFSLGYLMFNLIMLIVIWVNDEMEIEFISEYFSVLMDASTIIFVAILGFTPVFYFLPLLIIWLLGKTKWMKGKIPDNERRKEAILTLAFMSSAILYTFFYFGFGNILGASFLMTMLLAILILKKWESEKFFLALNAVFFLFLTYQVIKIMVALVNVI